MKNIIIILIVIIIVCSFILFHKISDTKNNINNLTLNEIGSTNDMYSDGEYVQESKDNYTYTEEELREQQLEKEKKLEEAKKKKQEYLEQQKIEQEKQKQEALNQRQEVLNMEESNQNNNKNEQQNINQQIPQQPTTQPNTQPNSGYENTNIILESRIENEFNGLKQYAIFELSNGQVWMQTQYKYTYFYKYKPQIAIYSYNGKYYIMIDGINDMVEVQQITQYKKAKLEKAITNMGNSTNSASINNIYFLNDGTVWKQSGLGMGIFLNNANVIVAKYGIYYYMQIDGVEESLIVELQK